jgi:TIR domain
LTKYDCEKSREFFYKLNDSERNDQIRNLAFQHLQSFGRYVKLRKKFPGKQKSYTTEMSDFEMTPADLINRINENQIQNKKIYDVFISHSSKDKSIIQKLIKALNKHNLNNYCDWTSDSDFLKRELVSKYTKAVLQKRLEQSKMLLFVRTCDSIESDWVKFELEFFKTLGKPMRCINFVGDNACSEFDIVEYDNEREIIVWN